MDEDIEDFADFDAGFLDQVETQFLLAQDTLDLTIKQNSKEKNKQNVKEQKKKIIADVIRSIEPENSMELTVHPLKLKTVRGWIESNCIKPNGVPTILVLTGPSGSAKSTAFRLLCKEYDVDVLDYKEDADVLISSGISANNSSSIFDSLVSISTKEANFGDNTKLYTILPKDEPIHITGVLESFREFIFRSTKVPSLKFVGSNALQYSSSNIKYSSRKVVLVDDIPNISHYNTKMYVHDVIRQYMNKSSTSNSKSTLVSNNDRVYPLVFVLTELNNTNAQESYLDTFNSDEYSISALIPPDVLFKNPGNTFSYNYNPNVTKITFNPVARLYLTRAVKQIYKKIEYILDYENYKYTDSVLNYYRKLCSKSLISKAMIDMVVDISQGDLRYLTTMCINRALWTKTFIKSIIPINKRKHRVKGKNKVNINNKRRKLIKQETITNDAGEYDDIIISSDSMSESDEDNKSNDDYEYRESQGLDPRDTGLDMFHFIGKILYGNRIAEKNDTLEESFNFLSSSNNQVMDENGIESPFLRYKIRFSQKYHLKENVEDLIYNSRINFENLLGYCFENYLSCAYPKEMTSEEYERFSNSDETSNSSDAYRWWQPTGLEHAAYVSDMFSISDYLNDPWSNSRGNDVVFSTSITSRYVLNAMLFYNSSAAHIDFTFNDSKNNRNPKPNASEMKTVRNVNKFELPKILRQRKLTVLRIKDIQNILKMYLKSTEDYTDIFSFTYNEKEVINKRLLTNFITNPISRLRMEEIPYMDALTGNKFLSETPNMIDINQSNILSIILNKQSRPSSKQHDIWEQTEGKSNSILELDDIVSDDDDDFHSDTDLD